MQNRLHLLPNINEISNFSSQPETNSANATAQSAHSSCTKSHTPFDTEAVGSDRALDAGSGGGSRFVWAGVTHQHLTGTAPALQIRGYELEDTKTRLFKPGAPLPHFLLNCMFCDIINSYGDHTFSLSKTWLGFLNQAIVRHEKYTYIIYEDCRDHFNRKPKSIHFRQFRNCPGERE